MDSNQLSGSGYSNASYNSQPARNTSTPAWSTPAGGYGISGGGSYFEGAIGSGGGGMHRSNSLGQMSFDDEPPLLEELGIDIGKIFQRTISVLNPITKVTVEMLSSKTQDGREVPDSDMAGPLLVALLLGACMLLQGKVHFGYIYGVGGVGCTSLWMVLTLMSHRGLDFWQMTSILGYCLLPMVLLAFFKLFFVATGFVMPVLSALVIGWCTIRSSEMLVLSMGVQNERALVAYPVALFYTCFAMLSIF